MLTSVSYRISDEDKLTQTAISWGGNKDYFAGRWMGWQFQREAIVRIMFLLKHSEKVHGSLHLFYISFHSVLDASVVLNEIFREHRGGTVSLAGPGKMPT